jgi:nicotinamide-nucleotide adenylyltransferase
MIVRLAQDVVGYNENGQPTAEANVAVAVIDEPRFVDKSRLLLPFLRKRLADLCSISSSSPNPSTHVPTPLLTFLQGLDALGCFFSPVYYESEEKMTQELRRFFAEDGDGCRVVCARRVQRPLDSRAGVIDDLEQQDREILAYAESHIRSVVPLREYIDSGRISLIDIGQDVQILSSSELRDKAQRGDDSWRRMTTSRVVDYIRQHNLYDGSMARQCS